MAASLLEMTKELVEALIETYRLSPEAMQQALETTHATLMGLQRQEETGLVGREVPRERIDWRRSITRQTVTCLECGEMFKQLTDRHLRLHGLDANAYRAKYRIPRMQALMARDVVAQRRQIAQRVRPWEKAPGYRTARRRRSRKQR